MGVPADLWGHIRCDGGGSLRPRDWLVQQALCQLLPSSLHQGVTDTCCAVMCAHTVSWNAACAFRHHDSSPNSALHPQPTLVAGLDAVR